MTIRRRGFLTGATTLAAAGGARADPADWTIVTAEARHQIVATPTNLLCRIFPAAGDIGTMASDPPDADIAMIRLGDAQTPIAWRVAEAARPNSHTILITLAAEQEPLDAVVTFKADPVTGMVTHDTLLRHRGYGPEIDIRATLGCCLTTHEPVDSVIYLAGAWTEETQIRRAALPLAPLALESRVGKTGFGFQPYIALRSAASTFVCELLWSGNWRLEVDPTTRGALIRGGINPWEFRHRLRSGATLRLPTFLFGRFDGGLNTATQHLHDWRRAHRPDPDRAIPVQYNGWYRYFGEPDATSMLAIIPVAARLGCEAFVIDAGWYRPDNDDPAAEWFDRTGDWRVSRRRFPDGLRPIAEACRALGMCFGLWFEPEGIGALSSIRIDHPEWLHHIDGKPPAAGGRAILHLGVPDAWGYAFDRVSRIIRTVGAGWVKWDFNADLFAGGWAPGLPADLTAEDPLVAHYHGLYALQDAIRAAFPDLILEMCASGGGRLDGAILSRAHVNWISDQPGPLRKLAIHFGSQLAHPAVACNDWLIEWPLGGIAGYDSETPDLLDAGDLPFRLRVAMLGSFGIGAPIDRWSPEEIATVAAHVALYRSHIRDIIHHGRQFLLTPSPPPDGAGDWAAIWYARQDGQGGVLFAFRLAGTDATRRFPLPGLRSGQHFHCRGIDRTAPTAIDGGDDRSVTVTLDRQYRSDICIVTPV